MRLHNLNIEKGLLSYFFFLLLFPTIRILLIGNESSNNQFELFISILPELFLLVLILISLITLFNKSNTITFSAFDKIFIFYISFNILLGTFLSNDLNLSLYGIRLTYFPMFIYFIGRFIVDQKENNIYDFINKLQMIFLIFALIGLLIYFYFTEFEKKMIFLSGGEINYYHIKRMTSILWTPVNWGSLMGVLSIISYFLLVKNKKLLNYLSFTIFSVCLFLSLSRGAIIAFLACFIVINIFLKSYTFFIKTSFLLIVCYSMLYYQNKLVYPALKYCFGSASETISGISEIKDHNQIVASNEIIKNNFDENKIQLEKNSTKKNDSVSSLTFNSENIKDTISIPKKIKNTRLRYWGNAFYEFKLKPLGYGIGKAGHIGNRFFKDENEGLASIYSTDGWYLKLLCETGVFGFLSYIILALFFVLPILKSLRNNKNSLLFCAFIIFVFASIQNIVSNVFDLYLCSSLIWLFVGISQNLLTSIKINESSSH